MNLPPKDFTPQEQQIAKCLEEFGLRYNPQHYFLNYTVDFWIPELNMIIEADGVYGHYKSRDIKRDMDLMQLSAVEYIVHIEETTYAEVNERIWQVLLKLEEGE